ncbi:acetylornithine transaminase [Chengkuizengella axinellae]|uniref:Acetylornithine aminotransferase n=1 Tax=Chengkuizengella axinellae TaxID=3064388 RepID=A0ABT9J2U2_9BACL|nr:acetylornithine transaminase [Chengkuizengella sp. 2205SS18-9]MDP5275900.1 acetylornithine transaminase [Chengkuizengella sp. 2205SS18-9]
MSEKSCLFPTYARFPITFVKGEGSRLWDDRGNEYLDMMSGLAVTNLGHAPESVKQKVKEQLDQLWHVSNLFTIPNQEKLASLLTDISCADAVFFCNSGAEANEAAIKLARRYKQKILDQDKYEIITFKQSFHGRTLATLTATGQEKVQDGFLPLPEGFVYAEYNNSADVEKLINEKTCAVMLEMVQGEGGVMPADPTFVKEVSELCKKHDLLLIVDEIQTGMGRTGKWFAYEHYGIEPDIISVAKGLGSGLPIGAMLGKEKLAEAFTPGNHATTFGGNPVITAASIATIEEMTNLKLPQRALELGDWMITQFSERLKNNSIVKEVRGKGLMIGIECTHPVADLIKAVHQEGVLVVGAGPNVIRLLPNLLVQKEDLQKAVDVICTILEEHKSAWKETVQ